MSGVGIYGNGNFNNAIQYETVAFPSTWNSLLNVGPDGAYGLATSVQAFCSCVNEQFYNAPQNLTIYPAPVINPNGVAAYPNGGAGPISTIEPGTTGQLAVYGSYLTEDGQGTSPAVHVSNGVTITGISSAGDNQLNVFYDATNATGAGTNASVTVTTGAGTSNPPGYIMVGDLTPVITKVTPNSFTAGTQTSGVVISGQHFGTKCQVAVTPALSQSFFTPTQCLDASVTGSLTLDPGAAGTITLTVTAEGYGSQNFDPTSTGEPQTASGTVTATQPSINVTRPSLTQASAVGAPPAGIYSWAWSSSAIGLSRVAGSTNTTSPNPVQLSNPGNPDPHGAPAPGWLAAISASYQPPNSTGTGVSTTFHIPVFGMSCYYTTSQSQWGTAPNNCSNVTISGTTYSGSVTNPPGLPTGSYCNSFLAELRLQGSAVLVTGTDVQYSPGSGFQVVTSINGADGTPVVAGRTVARDRGIIPKTPQTDVDINGVGSGLLANDTGGRIVGYRIDYYGGAGPTSCSSFSNIMGASGCSPANSSCPGDSSIQ